MTERKEGEEEPRRPASEPARPILVDPLEGLDSSLQSETQTTSARHAVDLDESETLDTQPTADAAPESAQDPEPAMSSQGVRQDSLLAYLMIVLPVGLAALFLFAVGWLTFPGLVIVTLASLGGALVFLRRHRAELASITGYLWNFAARPDQRVALPPAPIGSLLSGPLNAAVSEALGSSQRARKELTASDAGKEAVLAALPYPLLTLTAERKVTRANLAAKELFDVRLEGADLISVLREPALLSAAEAVLAGAESRTLEFTIAGGLMQHFVAQVRRLPVALPDRTIAILALQDITSLKRAEQLRADFVANASHELKTPLASLMGFIETLDGAARDDPEARARFLPIMAEQSVRMAHLVEDLLSLSRIEMHEHTPPRDVVELTGLLKRVATTLSLKAEKRQIALVVQAARPLAAYGDEEELVQVFQNLVDNAIKYGQPNSKVSIEVAAEEGQAAAQGRSMVSVSVIDQSEGIPREHLPRLTERFYRVDTARSRALGGTGLGLAIVKHIVSRHRGRLEIRSELGKGSVFTVHLRAAPLRDEQQDQALPKAQSQTSAAPAAPARRSAVAG